VAAFLDAVLGGVQRQFSQNALVIWITFGTVSVAGFGKEMLVPLCAALFVFPYLVFSALAGQLADKFDKSKLIRAVKLFEIAAMALAAGGFLIGNLPLCLAALLLMGVQATLFGPVNTASCHSSSARRRSWSKPTPWSTWAPSRHHFGHHRRRPFNGKSSRGRYWMAGGVLVFAALGYITSLFQKKVAIGDASLKLNFNPITPTWDIYKFTKQYRAVYLSILGISWFWFIGAAFLSIFPGYAKDILHANERVRRPVSRVLRGRIGVGSLICARLSDDRLELGLVRLVPLACRCSRSTSFYWVSRTSRWPAARRWASSNSSRAATVGASASTSSASPCLAAVYSSTLHPHPTPHRKGARIAVIAGNNILNATFMIASQALLWVLYHF